VLLCDPLGLILNAGRWWLAAAVDEVVALRSLTGLTGTRITRQQFDRPPSFDLTAAWANHRRRQGTT
jgi:hypothetical protein